MDIAASLARTALEKRMLEVETDHNRLVQLLGQGQELESAVKAVGARYVPGYMRLSVDYFETPASATLQGNPSWSLALCM